MIRYLGKIDDDRGTFYRFDVNDSVNIVDDDFGFEILKLIQFKKICLRRKKFITKANIH